MLHLHFGLYIMMAMTILFGYLYVLYTTDDTNYIRMIMMQFFKWFLIPRQYAYDKALSMHEESLKIRRSIYGDNHPHVTDSLNNIACVYKRIVDYQQHELFMPYIDFLIFNDSSCIVKAAS